MEARLGAAPVIEVAFRYGRPALVDVVVACTAMATAGQAAFATGFSGTAGIIGEVAGTHFTSPAAGFRRACGIIGEVAAVAFNGTTVFLMVLFCCHGVWLFVDPYDRSRPSLSVSVGSFARAADRTPWPFAEAVPRSAGEAIACVGVSITQQRGDRSG
jgi:hypothetical protein